MQEKVVLITGGSSGIGKALARVFGNAGYQTIITGRNEQTLEETATELERNKINVHTIVADASLESDNKRAIEEVIDKYDRLDILINNAGISMRALFQELNLEVFKKVMDINFMGSVYATKYALPYILKSKGSIIAISSINGHRGTPARTAYTASKYAMNGFFEALRTEVMKQGVHVLVVSPGFTTSNIRNKALTSDGKIQGESPRDEQKMMSAEEVAENVFKAMKKGKRDLILTGQGKLAVWLNKFIPTIMDRIVYNVFKKEEGSPLS
jgi:short-subunit dehydrogenase